jgi:UDP-N-acetylglucosamine 3-dehydrogenase
MEKVRVGVIGLGWFGGIHVDAYQGVYNAEVAAVCTRRPERLAEVAGKYGIKKAYREYNDLLADPDIDAVDICTHAKDHLAPMLAALVSGKHVILEKPMSNCVDDCDKIVEAAKDCKQNVMIGQICRFENNYALGRDAVLAGKIGDIVSMYARRNISALMSQAPLQTLSSISGDAVHDIDIMNWYVGKKAVSVYGMASTTRKDIKFPDIGWVNIKYENGSFGVAESCWNLPEGTPFQIDAKFEVVGTKGVLYVSDPSQPLIVDDGKKRTIHETVYWPVVHGKVTGALHNELQYFADCILKGEKPVVSTLEDSRHAVQICNAAEESARTDAVVYL